VAASFLTCWRACRSPSASPALPAASAGARFVGIDQMMKEVLMAIMDFCSGGPSVFAQAGRPYSAVCLGCSPSAFNAPGGLPVDASRHQADAIPGAVAVGALPTDVANPIPLPGGRQFVTLEDAAGYIMKLPKAEQNLGEWQAAIECLILVAEKNGPTMMARICLRKTDKGC
jgi:hypothetical protein